MNRNKLKAKIVERGMTVESFCKTAGFVRCTFDRKLNGASEFNRSEIQQICDVLRMTDSELREIFFDEVGA